MNLKKANESNNESNSNQNSSSEINVNSSNNIKIPTINSYAEGEDDNEGEATSADLSSEDRLHRQFIDWPVDSARMTRGYLPFKKRPHLGIDLAAPKGTSILAAHDGVVVYAGREFKGFGKMVLIEGAYGWASVYAHFTKIYVKTGERVKQGQILGGMGRTGRATGVHLHFELRKKKGPVDPLLYLPAAQAILQKQAKTNRSPASSYSNN
jgi:murein DD-endopeptidase MepM/ murein hydrolase activator NlpD